MPIYSAHQIADYFLFKADQQDQELLSNMKLQKLLYYAHGIHIAMGNGPLFQEYIEAWTYGPVVPSIYHKYKSHGNGCIPPNQEFDPSLIDSDTKDFLDEIFNIFGQFSAIRLMEISHSDECWKDAGDGETITNNALETCLKKYLVSE